MGLDWLPKNKPKPDFEAEMQKASKKWEHAWKWQKKKLEARIDEISITPYETIGAPCVGSHDSADEWLRAHYRGQNPDASEQKIAEVIEETKGLYVVPLAPPCDGVAAYTNGQPGGYVEQTSFRAQFLTDCGDIIGEDLFETAYEEKTPEELAAYGAQLVAKAQAYAATHGIDLGTLAQTLEEMEKNDPGEQVGELTTLSKDFIQSREFTLDVVLSAGRWCIYWGERGHGLDPYF